MNFPYTLAVPPPPSLSTHVGGKNFGKERFEQRPRVQHGRDSVGGKVFEQRGSVEAEQVLAGGQHVDRRIGEELEKVLEMIDDDGGDDFEGQQLVVDEEFDEGKGDERKDAALPANRRPMGEMRQVFLQGPEESVVFDRVSLLQVPAGRMSSFVDETSEGLMILRQL